MEASNDVVWQSVFCNFNNPPDDEVVRDGTDDCHWYIGNRVFQSENFDEKQHQSHPHDKEIEYVSTNDAYEVQGSGLRLECPVNSQEIVDAKGNKIAGNECNLIGGKETDNIKDCRIYQCASSTNDAEAYELLHLFVAE